MRGERLVKVMFELPQDREVREAADRLRQSLLVLFDAVCDEFHLDHIVIWVARFLDKWTMYVARIGDERGNGNDSSRSSGL